MKASLLCLALLAPLPAAAESIVDIMRERTVWPATVKLTRQVVAKFPDGEVRLAPDTKLTAVALLDNGDLVVRVAGRSLAVPFDCTDLATQAATAAEKPVVAVKSAGPWFDVAFDVEKILDDGVIARPVRAVTGEARRPHKMPPRIFVRMDTRGLPESAKLSLRLWATPAREGIGLPCYSTAEP